MESLVFCAVDNYNYLLHSLYFQIRNLVFDKLIKVQS